MPHLTVSVIFLLLHVQFSRRVQTSSKFAYVFVVLIPASAVCVLCLFLSVFSITDLCQLIISASYLLLHFQMAVIFVYLVFD